MLEEIGFEWVLFERRANVPWEETLSSLEELKKREGHCDVPQLHREDGNNLGAWANAQRQRKKKEKPGPDRQKMLEDTGFEWLPVERAQMLWEDKTHSLKELKKSEGHLNVPQWHEEDRTNLGAWASNQRQLKRMEKPGPDRQKNLEDAGFKWAGRQAARAVGNC